MLSRETPLDLVEFDEPDLAPPAAGPPHRPRFGRRARGILAVAAVTAVVVNAGAMWAYWKISAPAEGGGYVEMNLRGRSSYDLPLRPGATGDLTVTVTNTNDFPIRITSLLPSPGRVMADDEHRENGCRVTGVTLTRPSVEVRWLVARNNVAAFTVRDGLSMAPGADPACGGGVFTVPVRITGVTAGS
ncbi:hypothetical protein Asp14428_56560 [Actinoplanes sp. NBRC 14428]|nr:hypothetical protein Asp14428_56560 [Actinoplanes sp. NBRC 14428]